MKKLFALTLSAALLFSLAACGGSGTSASTPAAGSTAGASAPETGGDAAPAAEIDFAALKVGEDHTDLSADLKFITHRTDIVDTVFADYISEFQKLYPNISITYEGITAYEDDMTTRISTPSWGDICMVPATVPVTELSNYFVPFGDSAALGETYNFSTFKMYEGVTYGLPSVINVQGVLYNKAVFEQAGITELPKTPDSFIDALQAIKDNTDAVPLYTNFADNWPMTAWDAYIGGSATGEADFMNILLPHAKDPFADRGDGTGPFAVYNVLYQAVARQLTEEDPTGTDWESSKGMMNNGEIGAMVLGSWAITQMQEAGPNADDIGYMSFPITVNGKQYATSGPDYCYGVNKNSSADNQLAAMLYIKWLVENSSFDYDQGGVPVVIGREYPATLSAFEGIELVGDTPAKQGEENLFPDINSDSEVSLNSDPKHVSDIVETALGGGKSMEEIAADWNARWTASQEKYGVTPE